MIPTLPLPSTINLARQANNKTGTGTDQITTLKTTSGYRTVPMTDKLKETLLEYKESLIKEDKFKSDDYLFFGKKPITPSSISRASTKYMKLADMKEIRIHDFRHSFASMCIHLGANPNTLATIMDHS